MKFSISCHLVALFVFLMVLCDRTSAQLHCAQIDFNRTSYPEFRECIGKYYPVFIIKDYALFRDLKPYRPTAHYFLSNNFDSFSCIETSMHFVINANTTIEAAIFLKSIGNSFVEIVIYDADRNERIDSLRSDGTNGWLNLQAKMFHNINNAQVMEMLSDRERYFEFI